MSARRRLVTRWGLLSIAAIALLTLLAIWGKSDPEAVSQAGDRAEAITSVLDRSVAVDETPVRFVDVTAEVGLDFAHLPGGRQSLLPEDMGSGVAWADYDEDGDPDLFVVNYVRPEQSGRSALYRNDDGHFTDITEAAGLGGGYRGVGAAWADYDNDGDLDLYVTVDGPNRLYRNEAGRFTDVAPTLGVDDRRFGAGATWGDYDRDGWLDLYVTNYVSFEPETLPADAAVRQYQASIPVTLNPSAYAPQSNVLFRGVGDGRFLDVSEATGVANPTGRSMGAVWLDMDSDGWLDLYVANDVSDNGVFRNRGDGTFADIGAESLAADYRGAMGLAVADFDHDRDLDLFVTHWVAQENAFFENMYGNDWRDDHGRRRLFFMDSADLLGLGQSSIRMVGWATGFADFDNDGWLDLWVGNGHTIEQDADRRRLRAQPLQLFWREPGKGYRDVQHRLPDRVVRGGAHADFDGDGDLDIAVLEHGGSVRLLRNDSLHSGHWLALRLRQPSFNTRALGAMVTVATEHRAWTAQTGTGVSYLSQHADLLHFGLGDAKAVTVTVRWPNGTTSTQEVHELNRMIAMLGPDEE